MAKNPTYEQHLQKQGIEWEYVEKIPLSDINLKKGLQNQARLTDPLDDDLLTHYAQCKRDGDQFPAVVLWQPLRGMYVPIDGNTRLHADLKNGTKFTDAYVVKTTDPMVVDRMTWTWNNLVNGKRLGYEDCIQHAMTFVRKYGMAQTQAAKEWGVAYKTLSGRLRTEEIRDILNRNNVKITPTMNDHKLNELSVLVAMGEDVVAKAGEIISATGLDAQNIQEMCRAAKRAKTHEEKIRAVEEYGSSEKAEVIKAATKGGKIKTVVRPSVTLHNHCRAIERLLEQHTTDIPLRPLDHQFKDFQGCVETIIVRLAKIAKVSMSVSANQSGVA